MPTQVLFSDPLTVSCLFCISYATCITPYRHAAQCSITITTAARRSKRHTVCRCASKAPTTLPAQSKRLPYLQGTKGEWYKTESDEQTTIDPFCFVGQLKCDEAKPTCQRCVIESRRCLGYGSRSPRLSTTVSSTPPVLLSASSPTSAIDESTSEAATLLSGISDTLPEQTTGQTAMDTLLSTMWNDALGDGSDDWLTNGVNWMVNGEQHGHSTLSSQPPVLAGLEVGNGAGQKASQQGQDGQHTLLQAKLEAACSSSLQLAAVTQFFNHVAQCFHLIPVEANRWRIMFGNLCLQSDIVLRLVTAVGLVSLSHAGEENHRPAAYAHLTCVLRVWEDLVEQGRGHRWMATDVVRQAEEDPVAFQGILVIAVPILVGHLEQFDSGVSHQTNACMSVAKEAILTVLSSGQASAVDTGASSTFRFLTRIVLWWDTFSHTMGQGPGGPDVSTVFDVVRRWEQDEEMLDSTQCVVSWPLDLLEAVARTTRLSRELQSDSTAQGPRWIAHDLISLTNTDKSATLDHILAEARGIEMQIRSSRPRTVLQDGPMASELRFVVFEMMQAGTLIYFSRVLCGDTVHAVKEVDKVIRFLIRPNLRLRRRNGTSTEQGRNRAPMHPEAMCSPISNGESEQTRLQGQSNGLEQRTSESPVQQQRVSEWRHTWAADVAVIWSSVQAMIAVSPAKQDACRSTIQQLVDIGECGAVNVLAEVIEEIWLQRRRQAGNGVHEGPTTASNEPDLTRIWDEVMARRRWTQILIF